MPESSAWPDIRRWELHENENDEFDEEDEDRVVVHNELYLSEGDAEEDYNLQVIIMYFGPSGLASLLDLTDRVSEM